MEFVMVIAAVVLSSRIAGMENRSPWAWGAIAFAVCFSTALFFPYLPYLRVLIATVLVIVAMMVVKSIEKG